MLSEVHFAGFLSQGIEVAVASGGWICVRRPRRVAGLAIVLHHKGKSRGGELLKAAACGSGTRTNSSARERKSVVVALRYNGASRGLGLLVFTRKRQ